MTDIYLTGFTGAIGQRILPKLKEKNFKVYPINLRDLANLQSYKQISDNSWMIHLASINSKMTDSHISIEVGLMKLAIDVALKKGIQNFIFFSSSKLYPASANKALTTEDSEICSKDPYSQGKLECESIIKANLKKFKSVTILRLAPVLIRSKSSNVNLLFKLCETLPVVPIFSAGNQNQRSFLSFRNLERFLEVYVKKNIEGLNILNLCDKSPITTNMLINEFLTKYRPKVTKLELPKFLEIIFLNMPILGLKLNSLFADNIVYNNKLLTELSDLNLLETSEAINIFGLH